MNPALQPADPHLQPGADTGAAAPLISTIPAHAEHARLYELDILRFLAAFCVLLFHYSFRGAAELKEPSFTMFNYPAIAPFARYGYLGVNLFFMISGFVILMSAKGSNPRKFFISRFVRLFPAYWVCCSITFLVASWMADPRFLNSIPQYLANLTMLNGFVKIPYVDGAYWSLAVELRFYLLVFLLLAFRQSERLKIFLGIWLLGAILVDLHPNKYLRLLLMPEYAGYFVAGAAFYLAYLGGWSAYRIALLLISYVMVVRCALLEARARVEEWGPPFDQWVVAGCITAFFVVFFLIVAKKLRPLCPRSLLFLGTLTYPLYLLHQNLGYMIFNELHGRVNQHVLFWGVTISMILLAGLVHVFVERRYAGRLKRFLERVWQPGFMPMAPVRETGKL